VNLTYRILIGMAGGLIAGILIKRLGFDADHFVTVYIVDGLVDGLGRIFIASLMLMVVPIVFVSLTCGAASLGSSGNMGRLGGKTVLLYLLTTAMAVTLALCVALLVGPGEVGDAAEAGRAALAAGGYEPRAVPGVKETLVDIIPTNPVAAMAEGKTLQVIVFALLFGIALSRTGEAGGRVRAFFEDVNEVLMRLVTLLIEFAPIGVFCLMGKLFATVGWQEVYKLIGYFATVAVVLVLHAAIVYPTLLTVFARLSPVTFMRKMREPMLVAFSTSSSAATMPVTLRTVERRFGVGNGVASFAVPLGATINMDGTAIMQGVATVFIAQFYAIDLGLSQYLMVILTATLASIGTAAVPGVGLIMLAMVLDQVGLPVEGIMLIIGVDRLLDMMRTAVNVTGDGMVATIVAKGEGQLDLERFNDPQAGIDAR
jgi:Na+/H+-dicarboxylate symporter